METNYQFKTNINCAGCVASVKPLLDKEEGIKSWNVDTTKPEKILSANTNGLEENEIIQLIESAGYKIQKL